MQTTEDKLLPVIPGIKLSDVFWGAANEWLATDHDVQVDPEKRIIKRIYSCNAISYCLNQAMTHVAGMPIEGIYAVANLNIALKQLGVRTGSSQEFDEFTSTKKRQQVRYAWIMFLHQLALEERN